MGNIVAVVGRPNVGKSTLFNRLTETRDAIVDEFSGVTRDRHYGKVEWGGQEFSIIDTGGYISGSSDIFEEEIRKQVMIAIEESDLILFTVDAQIGITDLDNVVAGMLRKSGKKVLVIANKVDNFDMIHQTYEFQGFGLGEVFSVSSLSGQGTGDLLDKILEMIEDKPVDYDESLPKIAVVGRPNVGKSSITNALLGDDRNIVTPISGTTRDSIYTRYQSFGFDFYLIDTAGLRKKAKVKEDLEFYSTLRSVRTIEAADVCILMIDATIGFEAQDMNIFTLIQRNHKGVVILVNKWDLIEEKGTNTSNDYKKLIQQKIAPFTDVPIIFTSVPEKQRIFKALETAIEVYNNRARRIPTSQLNDFILPLMEATPPPSYKGKYVKIKYATQLPTYYPQFALFCNLPQYVREPYKRFLENKLRENYPLTGVPIEIYFRQK